MGPKNYIILALFTVAESVLVGIICTQYTQESVIICLAITFGILVSLTIFTCQTTIDFSGFWPYLMCAGGALFFMGMIMWICSLCGLHGPAFHAIRMVYAAFGALIFSGYIVFDTQMIIGGEHAKFTFSIDDYAMAAISLYLDIIQVFLFLLQLFGDRK